MIDRTEITMHPLSEYLTEYKELNVDNKYRPVAVGRYGIRARESIYSKELAKDYSKNRLIHRGTLTVGMGSVQMDIGILSEDITYSVSPAYHTYKINGVDYDYLRYCLQCRNIDMFTRYMKRGSRQGKSIDLRRWIGYEIPIYSREAQLEIVDRLDRVQRIVDLRQRELSGLDELIKARFVEVFGEDTEDGISLKECCVDVRGGGTPSMKHPEYYGGNVPFIKSGDVRGDTVSSGALWLTERALEETTAKYVPKGAVLVVNRSAALLREFRAAIANQPVVINQDIKAFIPNEKFTSEYLLWAIKIQTQFLLTKVTTVLTSHIDLKDLLELRIPLATIEQQNSFSRFLNQIDKSKAQVQKALDETQLLFDSLMQEYFG